MSEEIDFDLNEINIEERPKRNLKPFKIIGLIFGIGLILAISCFCIQEYTSIDLISFFKDNPQNDLTFEEGLCAITTGTPSWYYSNGTLAGKGYIPFGNASLEIVDNYLIPNGFYFVYSENCGWCHKQIDDFGETWSNYVKSGLTIDCAALS